MPEITDPKTRSMMRVLMREIEGDLNAGLGELTSPEQNTRWSRMQGAWAKLAAILDLGPEPETRACPTCGKPTRVDARRCGYCWRSLVV